ncbi:MAG: penicillin-binding transpeptidase domain-containing protein [Longimicrobiaceae bacterium]
MTGSGEGFPLRRRLIAGFLLAGSVLLAGRIVQLQAVEGERWTAAAEGQHRALSTVPARRGAILDRTGVPLAVDQEAYRVSVAASEVREPSALAARLESALGVSPRAARRAVAPGQRWVVLPGSYSARERRALEGLPGVYFERVLERYRTGGESGRGVVGTVTSSGDALGGVEEQFDRFLRGSPGSSLLWRRGAESPPVSIEVAPPRDGSSVVITLDAGLQEIAEGALVDAIRETGASGGDLLIVHPASGDVLAVASRRHGASGSVWAFTEPYEPGSTLKPFVVAALLEGGLVSLSDSVFAENGDWQSETGRLIRDVTPHGWLTLSDALRESSNVAMVKFAARLDEGEYFRQLRGFGFGTPTGIAYPSESAGRLFPPERWSALTQASLAMGYEVSVTPLQLVMAYAALANDGVLMEPRLVREVRAPDGEVLFRSEPRRVRQVVTAETARRVGELLASVVEDGTAARASLSLFRVAGKTGTARRTGKGGWYEPGSYTSTFVGYFPAESPQIAILVKLDEPRGEYYGGLIAAPVARTALRTILAARDPLLDRGGLARLASLGSLLPWGAGLPVSDPAPRSRAEAGRFVFELASEPPRHLSDAPPRPVTLPGVAGLSMREAVRRLHQLGLRVRLEGSGPARRVWWSGESTPLPGDTVVLLGRRG